MWVNSQFFEQVDNTLKEVFGSKFYKEYKKLEKNRKGIPLSLIPSLFQIKTTVSKINRKIKKINTIIINSDISVINDDENILKNLEKIDLNLKGFSNDIHTMAYAFLNYDFRYRLPGSDDFSCLRRLLNRMCRTLDQQFSSLRNEIDQHRGKISRLEETISHQNSYLDAVSNYLEHLAGGNFRVGFPFDRTGKRLNKHLLAIRQMMEEVSVHLTQIPASGGEKPFRVKGGDDLIAQSLNSATQSFRETSGKLAAVTSLCEETRSSEKRLCRNTERVADYIGQVAAGNFTHSVPVLEGNPGLQQSLETVSRYWEKIGSMMMAIAKHDYKTGLTVSGNSDLIGAAFNQMRQALLEREARYVKDLQEMKRDSSELQHQQKELLEFNFEFESRYREVYRSYQSTIETLKEARSTADRLQRRNHQLEKENRDLRNRNLQLSNRISSVTRQNRDLLGINELQSDLFTDLAREVGTSASCPTQSENSKKNAHAAPYINQLLAIRQRIHQSIELINSKAGTDRNYKPVLKETEREEIRLCPFLKELTLYFNDLSIETGINLTLNADEDLPDAVRTDRHRLELLLKNLVKNALSSSDSGKVSIRVFRSLSKNTRTPALAPAMLEFEINCEKGRPLSGHKIVMEAFKGTYSIQSHSHDDLFFGYAMLKELVDTMDGEIHLNCRYHDGHVYRLLIPLVARADLFDGEEGSGPILEDREPVIFFIDDSKACFETFSSQAEKRGYRSIQLSGIEEAVELSKTRLPVSLLLGVKWKTDNGLEKIEPVTQSANPRIPVFAVTDNNQVPAGWEKKCCGFISGYSTAEEIQGMLDRMEAFREAPWFSVAVLGEEDISDPLTEVEPFITGCFNYYKDLQSFRKNAERYDLVIIQSEMDSHSLETTRSLTDDIRQSCGTVPLCIALADAPSYGFRNALDPLVDAFLSFTNSDCHERYEIIRILLEFRHLSLSERKRAVGDYLQRRNTLLRNRDIVMVADTVSDTLALRKQLNLQNITIRVNSEGKNLLNVLEKNPRCDVVLLDINLPDKPSLSALTAVKNASRFSHIPIILLDNQPKPGDAEYHARQGASATLFKPLDFRQLLSEIRICIRLSEEVH